MAYDPANFGLSRNFELSRIEDMFFFTIKHLNKMDDETRSKNIYDILRIFCFPPVNEGLNRDLDDTFMYSLP